MDEVSEGKCEQQSQSYETTPDGSNEFSVAAWQETGKVENTPSEDTPSSLSWARLALPMYTVQYSSFAASLIWLQPSLEQSSVSEASNL